MSAKPLLWTVFLLTQLTRIAGAQLVPSSVSGVLVSPGLDASVLSTSVFQPVGIDQEPSGSFVVSSNCAACGIVRVSLSGAVIATSGSITDPDGVAIDGLGAIYAAGSTRVTRVGSLTAGVDTVVASGFSNLNDILYDATLGLIVIEDNGEIWTLSPRSLVASIPGGGGLGFGDVQGEIVATGGGSGGVYRIRPGVTPPIQQLHSTPSASDAEFAPGGYFGFDLYAALDSPARVVRIVAGVEHVIATLAPGSSIGRIHFALDGSLIVGDYSGGRLIRLAPTCTSSVAVYGVAKLSAIGCVPAIGVSGNHSVTSTSHLFVNAANLPNNRMGLMMYSDRPTSQPFLGGTLLVAPAIKRTPIQFSGGTAQGADCTGAFSFDLTDFFLSGAGSAITLGHPIYCQYWYRDPQSSFGAGLSNAAALTLCP